MKKILIVAHYFPPMNSTGSRRPEALARFLKGLGHEVTVLTTQKAKSPPQAMAGTNPTPVIETNLFNTRLVSNIPVQEEAKVAHTLQTSALMRFKQRHLNKTIGQMLDTRIPLLVSTWVKIALNRLSGGRLHAWLNPLKGFDVVISTAPPWTCHYLAYLLVRAYKLKWFVDYRDQISGNHLYSQKFAGAERYLDRLFCENAALVLTVSPPMQQYYQDFTNPEKVLAVMNGYEEAHFAALPVQSNQASDKESEQINIRYFGKITADRTMPAFWEALSKSVNLHLIQVEIYGEAILLENFLKANYPRLLARVKLLNPVPHRTALELMSTSDALLFGETSETQHASQRGVLTTKLFEYMACKRPIVGVIAPEALAGEIILKSGLGVVVSDQANELLAWMNTPNKQVNPNDSFIRTFSRDAQFEKIVPYL